MLEEPKTSILRREYTSGNFQKIAERIAASIEVDKNWFS